MTKQSNYQWKLPDIKDNYDEIVIDIVGNVDSGKSTLCGILSHPLIYT